MRSRLALSARSISPPTFSHRASFRRVGRNANDRSRPGWQLKAAGELAGEAALSWLSSGDQERPFFVFLNY